MPRVQDMGQGASLHIVPAHFQGYTSGLAQRTTCAPHYTRRPGEGPDIPPGNQRNTEGFRRTWDPRRGRLWQICCSGNLSWILWKAGRAASHLWPGTAVADPRGQPWLKAGLCTSQTQRQQPVLLGGQLKDLTQPCPGAGQQRSRHCLLMICTLTERSQEACTHLSDAATLHYLRTEEAVSAGRNWRLLHPEAGQAGRVAASQNTHSSVADLT